MALVACGAPDLAGAATSAAQDQRRVHTLAQGALDGEAHAADHARVAAAAANARTSAPSTTTRQAARAEQLAVNAAAVPAQDGQWEPPFAIPAIGIHATMLATGKVLWFYRTSSDSERGLATLWDPATRTIKQVPPPSINGKPANIFCAGQSLLPDGRVVVMGGQLGPNPGTDQQYKGLNTVFTFNPFDETWTRQPDMRDGRWYPTQVLTPDGRTIVMGGLDASGVMGAPRNPDIELFTPSVDLNGVGTVTLVGHRGGVGEPPNGGLYPHMFTMPSGRTLVAGPRVDDSWFIDPLSSGAITWSQAADPASHSSGTGVILPHQTPGAATKVALIAGGSSPSGTRTEVFDEAAPEAGWVTSAPLNVPRGHHNTVLLPDASMVTVGGGGNIGGVLSQFTADHLSVELYDPTTQTWRQGPSQQEGRAYHSTALLLPDARVLSAGDDTAGGGSSDTAELYSPPYLFKGARPAIESAPATIGFGQTFSVGFSGSDVARAALIAPGATTHANDMSQRFVPLSVSAGGSGSVTLTAPANAKLAPPSRYMLFLVSAEGVPSVARFVRLGGGVVEPEPGVGARLSAAPSSAALGSAAVGASRQLAVTVSNTGDAVAAVSAVTVGGVDAGQFSAPGGGFTLAAGASRDISVTFAPTSAGAKSAVMSVEYGSAAPSPLTVALSGTGEPPPPASTRTVSVAALADTGLDQNAPTVANGSAGEIRVDYQVGTDTTSALQGYVKFDVPPLAAGETITAAALGLQVSDQSPNGPHVYRTGSAWAESSLTWNGRTALATASPPGAAPISTTPAGNAGDLPIGRRRIALSGVTAAGLHSFEIRALATGAEADSGSDIIFASRQHPIAASRPTLELTITTP